MADKTYKTIMRKNWMPITALMLSLCAAVWFGGAALREVVYFNDPAHQDQELQPWMTASYVGLSYKLPPHVIDSIFDLERGRGKHVRVRDIADTKDMTLADLTALVRQEADAFRAEQQQ